MSRLLVVLLIAAVALVPSIAGATPLYFSGVPDTFVPGAPISFDVGLPPIGNLGAYNVELLLTSTSGIAGTDYYFDVTDTVPSPSNYVFSSSINFFDAANVDSPTQHRLTLTDFDFSGVNVVAGSNDLVAHVVIRTSAAFLGDLRLSFYADGLFLDTPDSEPVEDFGAIQADTEAVALGLGAVPEPSTLILGLVGVVATVAGLLTRQREPRRPTA